MVLKWNSWTLLSMKAIDFSRKFFFYIKIFQKQQNKYAYIPQKSNHRKHTIKNYVLNELKRYIKFNSNKLGFLRLRNKFFDRLRNLGFRKYGLSKLFAACSYSSRSKLLFKNDPVHISNVVQETAAEGVLMNLSETIFRQGMNVPFTATEEHKTETATEIKPFSRKDKVGCLSHSTSQKTEKLLILSAWFSQANVTSSQKTFPTSSARNSTDSTKHQKASRSVLKLTILKPFI